MKFCKALAVKQVALLLTGIPEGPGGKMIFSRRRPPQSPQLLFVWHVYAYMSTKDRKKRL